MSSIRKRGILLWTFLFPGWLAMISGGIGLANSLFGSSSGGGQQNTQPQQPFYQPKGQGAADQNWQNQMGQYGQQNANTQNNASPYFQQSLNQNAGINFNPSINAAQQAGQASQQAGYMDQNAAQGFYGQAQQQQQRGNQVYGAGMNTYQTALDPQNALYNRTAGQLSDQVNAQQAQRGLGNSAQGAGEIGQAMGNFNIDWQNQQLQRQIAGQSALNSGNQSANQNAQMYGADMTGASQMASAAPGQFNNAGQYPLQAQQYAANAPGQAASNYVNQQQMFNNPLQQQMSNNLQYMGYGQSAATGANSQFNSNQQFNANQQQSAMNGITQGLNNKSGAGGWLGNMFGGSGGGGGGTGWGNQSTGGNAVGSFG